MSNLNVLDSKNLIHDDFSYTEREINNRYGAVEVWSKDRSVLFREYFYIIDKEDNNVYLGDFKVPDSVNLERIERLIEKPI